MPFSKLENIRSVYTKKEAGRQFRNNNNCAFAIVGKSWEKGHIDTQLRLGILIIALFTSCVYDHQNKEKNKLEKRHDLTENFPCHAPLLFCGRPAIALPAYLGVTSPVWALAGKSQWTRQPENCHMASTQPINDFCLNFAVSENGGKS